MTGNEMIREFKVKIDKLDTQSAPDLYPEVILIFLNDAMDKVVDSKYTGFNSDRLGFEEHQKVTDDLKNLVKKGYIKGESYEDDNVFFDLSTIYPSSQLDEGNDEYLYFLRGMFQIQANGVKRFVGAKLVQLDDLNEVLDDPFNKPTINKPVMVFENGGIVLYLPSDSSVDIGRITYLKRPNRIVRTEECELDKQLHGEIVDLAISLALETIESQRVQTQPQISNLAE